MDRIARLDRVAKIYPRVHHPGERLRAFAAILAGREPRAGAEVLSDVSLEVYRGQSLGIVGENGAGKSTLLKVLTGVIQPSRGTVELNARVAALLELGAGFQPEFSGLDNIRMKAAILGLSRSELNARMDDIIEFADIGEYIHEPVKHYSSGMIVRLGFAVVTASRPELLITDEVLAVGDESFQKKCVRWIQEFLGQGGTLLMVTHSIYLVQKLCQQALWLHGGRTQQYGDAQSVTQDYLAWHEQRSAEQKAGREGLAGSAGHYRVADVQFRGVTGEGETPAIDGELTARLRLYSPDGRAPVCLVGIVRADGTPIFGVASEAGAARAVQEDAHHFRFTIQFHDLQLLPGRYFLRAHAMDPEALRVCDQRELPFRVAGEASDFGFVRLPHRWLTEDGGDS
jgi:lipopolysaccharide transport system ATP-binding protein